MFDGLGSVVATVSDSGVVQSTKQYDGYGAVRASSGGTPTKHKYVGNLGHTSEDETGLIYMRVRYYDPVTGRFESEDPKRDGVNWYIYANDNPINIVDPNGTEGTMMETGAGSNIAAIMDNIAGRIGMYFRDISRINNVKSSKAIQALIGLSEDPNNWRWVVAEIGGNASGFSSTGWLKAIVCISGRSAGAFLQMELELHGIPYAELTGLLL
ncbi:MAG: RHS repeat-associated core domain-containing protein [Armatimonadetes bacterium]|nr:RHS repeat-associated core domain-containing protein [Armatimonadota bacterium]